MGIKKTEYLSSASTQVLSKITNQEASSGGKGEGEMRGGGFIPNATSRHHQNDSASGWAEVLWEIFVVS